MEEKEKKSKMSPLDIFIAALGILCILSVVIIPSLYAFGVFDEKDSCEVAGVENTISIQSYDQATNLGTQISGKKISSITIQYYDQKLGSDYRFYNDVTTVKIDRLTNEVEIQIIPADGTGLCLVYKKNSADMYPPIMTIKFE